MNYHQKYFCEFCDCTFSQKFDMISHKCEKTSSKIEDRIFANEKSLKNDEKSLEKKKDQLVNESQFESTKQLEGE